jgi:hypothetical protein
MHTIQLEVSEEIYTRAKRVSKQTSQPIEKVVATWIHPPSESERDPTQDMLSELDVLSDEALVQLVRSFVPKSDSARLGKLLSLQKQRPLSDVEQQEARNLIRQQDLLTLQKAKAIFLLKKHNALPPEFVSA